jgi:CubicO group peptidase (beta-lactamase class C family)
VKVRVPGGAFLATVILVSSAWLVFYAHGSVAREANKLMEREVQRGFFSGAVLVSQDGRVLFERAYGMADAERKIPNNLTTRFRIGSITKTLTAIIVMQLEGEHRLALTDSICSYIRECPASWADVQLHHLLSHTSGIYDYTRTKPGEAQTTEQLLATPHTQAEIFRRFTGEPLAFDPGDKFEYSNSNYWLLTRVIEKVTGQSYEEVLRQRVFEPAAMHDSGLIHEWPSTADAAVGYWMTRQGKIARAPVVDGSWSSGDGGVYSTVLDLEKFSDALEGGKLIPRATLQRMRTPVTAAYGYGWSIPPVSAYTLNRKQVNHGGALPGFLSQFQRFETEKLTLVVLSNNQRSDPTEVAEGLAAVVFNEPFTPTNGRTPVEVPEGVLHQYVGDYELQGAIWTLFLRDGHLYARAKDGSSPDLELLAESEDVFFIRGVALDIAALKNEKGEVTGLVVAAPDTSRYMKKVR